MAKEKAVKPKKEKKPRSRKGAILMVFLGLVIFLIGAYAVIYLIFPDEVQNNPNLTLVKNVRDLVTQTVKKGKSTLEQTIEKGMSVADSATGKLGGLRNLGGVGERTYTVKRGETLWGIAKGGQLVNSGWEWRTILHQNSEKIDYAFISKEEGAWKIMLEAGRELKVAPADKNLRDPVVGKKWVIQLAALNEKLLKRAVNVVRLLIKNGHYAYLTRHEADGQVWLRIRSGFFDSKAEAEESAGKILTQFADKKLFPEKAEIYAATKEEKQGGNLVFGAQLTKPWVIELADRETHSATLKDLRKLRGSKKFAYIWQEKNAETRRFVYRVRIGFFASEKSAKAVLKGKTKGIWENARVSRIKALEETLPGQPHKLGEAPAL